LGEFLSFQVDKKKESRSFQPSRTREIQINGVIASAPTDRVRFCRPFLRSRVVYEPKPRVFNSNNPIEKIKSSSLWWWMMFGGRSLLKRRASIHRAQRHATRHFPTRKTTRIALKTTLSIKRARKIEPHIPDLLLNLAPCLPRGAHILDVLRST
jgi:hypothetical protein